MHWLSATKASKIFCGNYKGLMYGLHRTAINLHWYTSIPKEGLFKLFIQDAKYSNQAWVGTKSVSNRFWIGLCNLEFFSRWGKLLPLDVRVASFRRFSSVAGYFPKCFFTQIFFFLGGPDVGIVWHFLSLLSDWDLGEKWKCFGQICRIVGENCCFLWASSVWILVSRLWFLLNQTQKWWMVDDVSSLWKTLLTLINRTLFFFFFFRQRVLLTSRGLFGMCKNQISSQNGLCGCAFSCFTVAITFGSSLIHLTEM